MTYAYPMELIELDLDKPEYDEQFSAQELWQQQSAIQLLKHLEHFGLEARNYVCTSNSPGGGQNLHNAILISGGRGTGKSVFLKNAQALWVDHKRSDNNLPSLYFAPIIDPTLLQDHDSFTNVLVAHIYNQVMNVINSGTSKLSARELENAKDSFFQALRSLSEAVQYAGEHSEHVGLDKIIQYSSGIKIDCLFHEYIRVSKLIFGCDAIVISIDDVDMALENAYDVLEEIRRRLSCPDIIPLVSGELELYHHLVKLELTKSLDHPSYNEVSNGYGAKKSNELADAYLAKVLPNHYRIALKPIAALLPHLTIKDSKLNATDTWVSYKEYQQSFKEFFFGSVNGQERSAEYPSPQSAREVGQLVRLLAPSSLKDDKRREENWESLRVWSESQQHGSSYALARSALQSMSTQVPLKLSELLIFNIRDQASERLPWASHKFCEEQVKFAQAFDKSKGIGNNVSLLENLSDARVIRSMPPLEMFTDYMSITRGNTAHEKNRYTLGLYTHSAYYATQGSQQRKVYFSKAFELLTTSILMSFYGELCPKQCEQKLKEVMDSTPFYSIHALNPTKYVDEDPVSLSSIDTEEDADTGNYDEFIGKVMDWSNSNRELIKSFVGDETRLLALLVAVFNKVFSQLNLLRERYHKGNNADDTLIDAILRFKYILVNAFGFLLSNRNVVPANLALDSTHSMLRDLSEFSIQSKTYQKNVGWINEFLVEGSGHELDHEAKAAQFINAVSLHPVFIALGDGVDINKCVDLVSAPITNQNGVSRNSSDGVAMNKPKSKTATTAKQGIDTLKEWFGNGKRFNSAKKLESAIKRGELSDTEIEGMTKAVLDELGENPEESKYHKSHWDVYQVLLARKNK